MLNFEFGSLLTLGLPLVGLPLLIHLITRMRHRKVRFAAMEFLLQSRKKHRTWIRLREWLLLLLRTLAIAAVVLMAAQPRLRHHFGALLGSSTIHHVVLLDDSFSMADRRADGSLFEQAKEVVEQLASQAGQAKVAQEFTLLRFSRAARRSDQFQADVLQETVDLEFPQRLAGLLEGLAVSESAAGPEAALHALTLLPPKAEDEDRLVYLISDFRAPQWNDATALREAMLELNRAGVQLHLIHGVDTQRGNLAITALEPGSGTRAAGVPLMVKVAVTNFGTTTARDVAVLLAEDNQHRPSVVLDEIPPGETVTQQFSVMFSTAGEHQIHAQLPSDPVEADNGRDCVVVVPDKVPVLVIDGDPHGANAFFLTTALAPGGRVNSGVSPVVESPRALRHEDLARFHAIYLLDVERLDAAALEALEAYVRGGGGLAIFVGERCDRAFYRQQMYRNGEGLFPAPLAYPTELLVDRVEKAPDLTVSDHPIFAFFAGERNTFLRTVNIRRYYALRENWEPAPDSGARVLAQLRNGAPLAIERGFGQGRVVAFLTKASPVETEVGAWNDWARGNPSYVVTMLELQSYLGAIRYHNESRVVGTPLELSFAARDYEARVQFRGPEDESVVTVDAAQSPGQRHATFGDTFASGVYEAQLMRTDGILEMRRYAYNVLPAEGDLDFLGADVLERQLEGVEYQMHRAETMHIDAQQLAGFNLGESLMFGLIALLMLEQVVAYVASYHPRPQEAIRR